MNKVNINIPFPGFYDSVLSSELDSQLESHCRYQCEESGDECEFPEHMRLTEDELSGIISDNSEYSAQCSAMAKDYVNAFESVVREYLPFPLKLYYEAMTSPKYYNFETDRVFCDISEYSLRRLAAISRNDSHKTLAKVIKARFTSCDGFSSFYSNDLADWLEKPLADWDHNECGTLLIACLMIGGLSEDRSELTWEVYERMMYSGDGAYSAWSNGVQWDNVQSAIDSLREEKDQDYKAEFPELAECPFSIKYFSRDPAQLSIQF